MNRSWTLLGFLLLLILAGLGMFALATLTPGGFGADDPRLSLPPEILTPQEVGKRQRLFDHATLQGWVIKGPAAVKDGTLVLGGGTGPTTAFLTPELDPGQTLDFQFFQEGAAGATLCLRPVLRDPNDPHAKFRQDYTYPLNLSGFVYKRWHSCQLQVGHAAEHLDLSLNLSPLRDGNGLSGSSTFGFPTRHGCRCRVGFEVPPGSTVYLRNVLATPAPPQP